MSHPLTRVRPLVNVLIAVFAAPTVALADGKADVQDAINKLAAANNYTWSTRYTGGGGTDASGKVDTVGGLSSVATTAGGKPLVMAGQYLKQAIRTDAGWKSLDDLLTDPAAADVVRVAGQYMVSAKVIHWQVRHVPAFTAAPDGTLVGDLPAADALAAANPPPKGTTITAAQGTVTVALAADGTVSRIVTHLTATATPGGPPVVDRTITTAITDVNHTTPDVPPEAQAILAK